MIGWTISTEPKEVEEFIKGTSENLSAPQIAMIETCVYLSESLYVGYINEEKVCAFGLIPPSMLAEEAHLWLHTTSAVEEHKFVFIRHSQLVIEKLLEKYPTLIGYVIKGNNSALRWLKWLGATFNEPKGRKIPFEIKRQQHG